MLFWQLARLPYGAFEPNIGQRKWQQNAVQKERERERECRNLIHHKLFFPYFPLFSLCPPPAPLLHYSAGCHIYSSSPFPYDFPHLSHRSDFFPVSLSVSPLMSSSPPSSSSFNWAMTCNSITVCVCVISTLGIFGDWFPRQRKSQVIQDPEPRGSVG